MHIFTKLDNNSKTIKSQFMRTTKSPFRLLFEKEFLFDRYDEITGKRLYTKNVDLETNKNKYKHEYRGLTLYFKEVIESALAIVLIISFLILVGIFFYQFLFKYKLSFDLLIFATEFLNFSKYLLYIAGGFLLLDSLLLISALISSPGIDETIDSVSVTIAGVLLIFIGNNADEFVEKPMLILTIIVPLSLIVVVLIFAKHLLRRMNGSDYFRNIEGMDIRETE
jgi:hypothetical protein